MTSYGFEIASKKNLMGIIKEKYDEDYEIGDLHVVWFAKTLQNIKTLIVDNGKNNRYYECTLNGEKGEITLPMFHMARRATLKADGKKEVFMGKTDYLTEFTHVAEEIKAGRTESVYIPFESTKSCMKMMDECRKQMNLVYPFEIK